MEYKPAEFDGKRLVTPSTCLLHPKYQALRPPTSDKDGCTCSEIYFKGKLITNRRWEAFDPIDKPKEINSHPLTISWDEHR